MTVNITVDKTDFEKFIPALEETNKLVEARLVKNNRVIAEAAVEILTEYPPVGEGNFPPAPYWERGVGMIGAGGNITEPSRQYGESKERWGYKTAVTGNGVITVASTGVPYAPYVGSPELQTSWHKDRGWKTTDEVEEKINPIAQQSLENTVEPLVELYSS